MIEVYRESGDSDDRKTDELTVNVDLAEIDCFDDYYVQGSNNDDEVMYYDVGNK